MATTSNTRNGKGQLRRDRSVPGAWHSAISKENEQREPLVQPSLANDSQKRPARDPLVSLDNAQDGNNNIQAGNNKQRDGRQQPPTPPPRPSNKKRRTQRAPPPPPPSPPTLIIIPAPPRSACEMKAACSDAGLRKELHKAGRASFQRLLDEGYVLEIDGPHTMDFGKASDENCGKYKVLYAMVDKVTGELKKIGLAGILEIRKAKYQDHDKCYFIPFLKLRQLEKEMDSFLQGQCRELVAAVRNNEGTPEPVRKLFEMVVDRGGEEFGVKGNFIYRIIEVGAQLYHGVGVVGEVCMHNASVFDNRKRLVAHAVEIIKAIVHSKLDTTKKIEIHIVTSWNHAYYRPRDDNPDGKLTNKHVFTECAARCVINDLREHDTVPAPANVNATTADEAFSRDYPKTVLDQGRERLRNFLRAMNDNSFMLLDTNKILCESTTFDIVRLLEGECMYDYAINVWNEQSIILTHAKQAKVVALHCPFCFGGDSRSEVPLWQSNLRTLLIEVLKIVTHSLLPDDETIGQDIYGDGVFGSFVFEWFRTAVGLDKKVSAAALRDTLTPKTAMALHQNVSGRTISDPFYPITKQLRHECTHGKENATKSQKHLSIRRATNVLSFVCDAHDSSQIAAAMERAEKIIMEDEPTYDTKRDRWDAALADVDPNSPLRQEIERVRNEALQNEGNLGAHGLPDEVKDECEIDFHAIMQLHTGAPFYVRSADSVDGDLPKFACAHPIFRTFAEAGLKGRLQQKQNPKDKTKATKATRSSILLTLVRVLGRDGRSQHIDNGSFILCKTSPRSEMPKEQMEQEMKEIESQAVGERFWARMNRQSNSEIPPPCDTPHTWYKMPVFNSVRDRLSNKKDVLGKKVRKIMKGARPVKSKCDLWFLCEIDSVN